MRNRIFWWVIGLLAAATFVGVGVYTYNLGLAQGIAESARLSAERGGAVPVPMYYLRPWGFGFSPFFPFLFIVFWFFVLRGLLWRGAWRGRRYGKPEGGSLKSEKAEA